MASSPVSATAPASGVSRYVALLPGLVACFAIGWIAIRIKAATGLSALNPVVVALLIGIAIRATVGIPRGFAPGAAFAVRPVLRTAVVLLGLQVTLQQLISIGVGALTLAVAVVVATLVFAMWLGKLLKVDPPLAQLIGTGTGICGASAIIAANQVVRGKQEDVTYALAIITLFGTISILLYPALDAVFGMSTRTYGLWAGSSIHEVVQVAGAAAAVGPEAFAVGTITKLARVVMLAPAVLGLGMWIRRGERGNTVKTPVPWFAFGFIALILVGSTGMVPRPAVEGSYWLVPLMMGAAIAGLGLNTDLRALRDKGIRPLLLGLGAWAFIALLGLAGALLLG